MGSNRDGGGIILVAGGFEHLEKGGDEKHGDGAVIIKLRDGYNGSGESGSIRTRNAVVCRSKIKSQVSCGIKAATGGTRNQDAVTLRGFEFESAGKHLHSGKGGVLEGLRRHQRMVCNTVIFLPRVQ